MKHAAARLSILAALLWSLVRPAPAWAAEPAATVRPGAFVRWPGPALLDCSIGQRHWQPLDGACWYPIDLEARDELELVRRSTGGVASRRVRVASYPYPTQRLWVEEKYVAPPPHELERIARERARVEALFELETPRRFSLPLGAPLERLPNAARFGARRIFNGAPRSPHSGADYSARAGTLVRAVGAGRVAVAANEYFAGNAVYIDHGDGLLSMSFHLAKLLVRSGEQIERGQPIGTVGATGRATGPHLHFGLRWHGARVDPDLLLGPLRALEID